MIPVIIYLLYLETVLIIARPGVTIYNVRFTVYVIFRPLKANTWRFKNKSCNRNEPNNTLTWQIIEVSNSTRQYADNSRNHADL